MVPVYCPLCCDQPFNDQQDLFFHLRGIRNNLFCPICLERFANLEVLVTHLSRKCYGPSSPPTAKRKCLANIGKPAEVVESSTFQPKETQTTDPLHVEPSNASSLPSKTPDSTTTTKQDESAISIPPEIRHKLSKNMSVSLEPVKKTDDAIPVTNGPTKLGHEDKWSPSNNLTKNRNVEQKGSQEQVKQSQQLCTSSLPASDKTGVTSSNLSDAKHKNAQRTGPRFLKVPEPTDPESKVQPSPAINTHSLTGKRGRPRKVVESSSTNVDGGSRGRPRKNINESRVLTENESENGEKDPLAPSPKCSNESSQCESNKCVTSQKSKENNVQVKGKKMNKDDHSVPNKIMLNGNDSDSEGNDFGGGGTKDSDDDYDKDPDFEIEVEENLNSNKKAKNGKNTKPNKKIVNEKENNNSKVQTSKSNKKSLTVETTPENDEKTRSAEEDETETKDDDDSNSNEEYTCSACNVQFTSVYEHVSEYHEDEKVQLEMAEEEVDEKLLAYAETCKGKVSIQIISLKSDCKNNNNKNKGDSRMSGSSKNKIAGSSSDQLSRSNSMRRAPRTRKIKNRGRRRKSENDAEWTNTSDGPTPKKKGRLSKIKVKNEDIEISEENFNPNCSSPLKKLKKPVGKWIQSMNGTKSYYQFVIDHGKHRKLSAEMKNNKNIHPELKQPIKELFENPKISIIEITDKENRPSFVHRPGAFRKAMPLYVVQRPAVERTDWLGGSASYVLPTPPKDGKVRPPRGAKLIAVMQVLLMPGDDKVSLENIVFKEKPVFENMLPLLRAVKKPDIPLLENSMMLRWQCSKCLTTTWKFPLSRDPHQCMACTDCHKPFASKFSLNRHIETYHKKEKNSLFCKECQVVFLTKELWEGHQRKHESHTLCAQCKQFVPKAEEKEHEALHQKSLDQQFPCSVCNKVFGSREALGSHEERLCARLVAKYDCPDCDRRFYSPTSLTYHTRHHRTIKIRHSCRYCSKTFILENEQILRKAGERNPSSYLHRMWHERIHSRDRPFMCAACSKRFRSKTHLQDHERVVHRSKRQAAQPVPGRRDFPVHMCGVCDKMFQNPSLLTAHLSTHQQPEPEPDV